MGLQSYRHRLLSCLWQAVIGDAGFGTPLALSVGALSTVLEVPAHVEAAFIYILAPPWGGVSSSEFQITVPVSSTASSDYLFTLGEGLHQPAVTRMRYLNSGYFLETDSVSQSDPVIKDNSVALYPLLTCLERQWRF